ncbi:MAG: tetratricopeptide repeat protein [Bacteriovorax sp.]|jgi:tetratricopeptide (TPR) repeat protein
MKRKILSLFIGLILLVLILEVTIKGSAFLFTKIQDSRNQTHVRDSKKKILTILAIGESTTAVAANENNTLLIQETAYPVYLEKFLNEKQSQYQFEVINKGIMSGDTKQIVLELKKYLKNHNPDIIVAMMGMKDTQRLGKVIGERGSILTKVENILIKSSVYNLLCLFYNQFILRNPDIDDTKLVVKYEDIPSDFLDGNFLQLLFESIHKQLQTDPISNEQLREVIKDHVLGQYFLFTGQYKKAEENFKKSIQVTGYGYFILSNLYITNNDAAGAENILKEYLKKHPENPYVYKDLVLNYINYKELKKAEKILHQAKENGLEKDPAILIATVQLEKEKGHFEKGVAQLEYKCGVKNPTSFSRFDYSKKFRGELSEFLDSTANKVYIENIMKKFSYEECVFLLSQLYYSSNNLNMAEANLKHFRNFTQRYNYAADLLRRIYEKQGKNDMAVEFIRTMAKRNKRLGEYFALVNAYRASNRFSEIQNVYESTRKDFPQTSEHFSVIHKLAQQKGAKLILMQYPTFSLDFLKSFTSDLKHVYYVSNENIFNDGAKINYFFEPRFPYTFNHYTAEGSQILANNLSSEILKGLQEGKL